MRFAEAVRDHKTNILIDTEHMKQWHCGRSRSSTYAFTITTWPGYLTITGDMGCYTFRRERDMLSWFNQSRPAYEGDRDINPDYWSGKLEAQDTRRSGYEVFSEDAFEISIREAMAGYLANFSLSQAKRIVLEAQADDLFRAPDGRDEALSRVMNWKCPVTRSYPFDDFWDSNTTEYDFGFLQACHAILWGIKQYDMVTQGRTQADVDRRTLSGAL
jgi:hypothetical protein